jgi:excinuclease ABC subunit C
MLTKEMIANLPALPGVYFFKGRSGKILYIGKAKSLRQRVQSYLYKHNCKGKIKRLVNSIVQLNYEICGSELEAFLLESRLIKKYRPSYNLLYKNNQNSPFIKVNLVDDFPRVELVFNVDPDDAKYFGPFSSIKWTAEVVDVLHKIFPIRTCEMELKPDPDFRPCLEYHLKRCGAPCAERVSGNEYHSMINDVIRLLDGGHQGLIEDLVVRRDQASSELRFEKAAALQRRIEQLRKVFIYLDVHRRN